MRRLSLDQEQDLLKDWMAGIVPDEVIYNQYKGVLRFFISKKVPPHLREDCFQVCSIALFEIAHKYDFRPVRFTTFLISQLRGVVTQFMRDNYEADIVCVELDEIAVHSEEVEYFSYELHAAISALNEQEKELIYLRYFKEMTTNEIAKIMHIPRGSLSKMENKAIAKMRTVLCPASEEDERMLRMKAINFDDIL